MGCVVGPAGLEDAAPDRARLCHVASGCAYECHTSELVASRRGRGCARSCQDVSGCDQASCTLHCTLGPQRSLALLARHPGKRLEDRQILRELDLMSWAS